MKSLGLLLTWLGPIAAVVSVFNYFHWGRLNYKLQQENHRLQQEMKEVTLERDKRQALGELAKRRLQLDKLAFCVRAIRDRTYKFSSAKTVDFRKAIESFDYNVPYLDEAVNLAFEGTPEDFRDEVVEHVEKTLWNYKKINDLVVRDTTRPWDDDLRRWTVETGGCSDSIDDLRYHTHELLDDKTGLLTARIPPFLDDSNVQL